jgi:hypothetical protein
MTAPAAASRFRICAVPPAVSFALTVPLLAPLLVVSLKGDLVLALTGAILPAAAVAFSLKGPLSVTGAVAGVLFATSLIVSLGALMFMLTRAAPLPSPFLVGPLLGVLKDTVTGGFVPEVAVCPRVIAHSLFKSGPVGALAA